MRSVVRIAVFPSTVIALRSLGYADRQIPSRAIGLTFEFHIDSVYVKCVCAVAGVALSYTVSINYTTAVVLLWKPLCAVIVFIDTPHDALWCSR